jgi:hypothetical protein
LTVTPSPPQQPNSTHTTYNRSHGTLSRLPPAQAAYARDCYSHISQANSTIVSNAANVSCTCSRALPTISNTLVQLKKYMDLPQKGAVMAEYVWIDGSNGVRSKSRVSLFQLFVLQPRLRYLQPWSSPGSAQVANQASQPEGATGCKAPHQTQSLPLLTATGLRAASMVLCVAANRSFFQQLGVPYRNPTISRRSRGRTCVGCDVDTTFRSPMPHYPKHHHTHADINCRP